MNKQLFIGIATEGPTDKRFLSSIILRTFKDIAFRECSEDIEIYPYLLNTKKTGLSFPEYVVRASHDGVCQFGMMTLVIHADSDKNSYFERWKNMIEPAQMALDEKGEDYCKLLTPIIPIRMIEAWMLADKTLLKSQIGTSKSDADLGINRDPETIADPKHVIKEAIRIATEHLSKRRQRLSISELYEIIGDSVSLTELARLDSYRQFQDAVRNTYRALNYMR